MTEIVAVLFTDIVFVQIEGLVPEERFVIVIVVFPLFARIPVVKDPDPAVATVIVAVNPEPEFAPDRAYVTE